MKTTIFSNGVVFVFRIVRQLLRSEGILHKSCSQLRQWLLGHRSPGAMRKERHIDQQR